MSLLMDQYISSEKPLDVLNNSKSSKDINKNFVEYTSTITKKRMFDMYLLFSQMLDKKEYYTNSFVKNGIRELLEPFFKYSVKSSIENSSIIKRSNEIMLAESTFSSFISKATNVKNVTTYFVETDKEFTKHMGISVYITKSLPVSNRLYANFNNGFFQFSDGNNISINIFIPLSYIPKLMISVEAINGKEISSMAIPNVEFRSKCRVEFENSLFKAFFYAIYRETNRLKVVSDILHLIDIGKNEYFTIQQEFKNQLEYKDNIYKIIKNITTRYEKSIKDQYNKYEYENTSLFEDIYKTTHNTDQFPTKSVNVSPKDFYEFYIHIPKAEIETVYNKFNLHDSMCDVNNDLETLDIISKSKNNASILAYTIKIERLLPFILYNCYFLGMGSTHSNVNILFTKIYDFMPLFKSFELENTQNSLALSVYRTNIDYYYNIIYRLISSPTIFSPSVISILNIISTTFYQTINNEENI